MYRRIGKRALDLALVALILPVLGPVMGFIALAVRLRLGAPVFFRQWRPGLNERPFQLVKFRTMTDARDAAGRLLPDADRLTPFGQFLRSTSLDELPELLINVVRGDLSLVGPRPLLMEYLPLYSETQRRRHEVLPGVTGWAQIHGRNATTWERRFELDVWYVDQVSFWLEVHILWRTLTLTLNREGISQEGQATREKFLGNQSAC